LDEPVTEPVWGQVDEYVAERLLGEDEVLAAALADSDAAGLPEIQVSAAQGKFLQLLARIAGARSVLEIGTLGGYSTIWLGRALPADGRLVSLEVDAAHAEVARRNLDRAGLSGVASVLLGPAAETLPTLDGPFDLVFIDADKPSNPIYLREALRVTRPGSIIVVDNVVRGGKIVDPGNSEPHVLGTRATYDLIAAEPRLDATALQTVGGKGYDGFAIALVS
jgi:predicted O-methyltransferase YrrM